MSPQLLGRMKGWSCSNKIPVFFFFFFSGLRSALLLSPSVPDRPPAALRPASEAVSQDPAHRQSWIQPLPVSRSVIQMAHPRDAVTQITSPSPTVAAREPVPGTRRLLAAVVRAIRRWHPPTPGI